MVAHGQKNVPAFCNVVGGLQLMVVQDGESVRHGGGVGGGTDLGAVPGSGGAKEGSESGVFLAVGGRGKGGDEKILQSRKRVCGVHETEQRLVGALRAVGWSRLLSAARFGHSGHAQWRGPAMEMATNVVVRKARRAPARAPGFATDRAEPSHSPWIGCCLCVLEVPGSKEHRGPVFWEAGATAPAATRRRRHSVYKSKIRRKAAFLGIGPPKNRLYHYAAWHLETIQETAVSLRVLFGFFVVVPNTQTRTYIWSSESNL